MTHEVWEQSLQIIGALLVLAGFASAQFGWWSTRSVRYLLVNAAGSTVLAVLALIGSDWGFLLLEGAWALISWSALVRRRLVRTQSGNTSRLSDCIGVIGQPQSDNSAGTDALASRHEGSCLGRGVQYRAPACGRRASRCGAVARGVGEGHDPPR
ncbi:MAG: CBU_0592 family membrane protein [Nocardioidaceae bacterium]